MFLQGVQGPALADTAVLPWGRVRWRCRWLWCQWRARPGPRARLEKPGFEGRPGLAHLLLRDSWFQ